MSGDLPGGDRDRSRQKVGSHAARRALVKAAVDAEDPDGFLALGAPEDEYDAEVDDLVRLRPPVMPEDVGRVWEKWFGPTGRPLGGLQRSTASRLATAVEQAWEAHPEPGGLPGF